MKQTLGQMLRDIRHERGETLEDVAQATGISIAMLSRVERDQRSPSPSVISVLAEYYQIPDDMLLGRAAAQNLAERSDPRSRRWASRWLSESEPDVDTSEIAGLGVAASMPTPVESGAHSEPHAVVSRQAGRAFSEQPIEELFGDASDSLQDAAHVAEVALERAVREAKRALASGNPERVAEAQAVLERLGRALRD